MSTNHDHHLFSSWDLRTAAAGASTLTSTSSFSSFPLEEPLLLSTDNDDDNIHLDDCDKEQQEQDPLDSNKNNNNHNKPRVAVNELASSTPTTTTTARTRIPFRNDFNVDDDVATSRLELVYENGRWITQSLFHLSPFQILLLCGTVVQGVITQLLWTQAPSSLVATAATAAGSQDSLFWTAQSSTSSLSLQEASSSSFWQWRLGWQVIVLRLLVCLAMEVWDIRMQSGNWYDNIGTSLVWNGILHFKDALKPAVLVVGGIVADVLWWQLQLAGGGSSHIPSHDDDDDDDDDHPDDHPDDDTHNNHNHGIALFLLSLHGMLLVWMIPFASQWIFRYQYTPRQWTALTLAGLGSILAHVSSSPSSTLSAPSTTRPLHLHTILVGFGTILLVSFLQSMTTIYGERFVKQDLAWQRGTPPSASLWIRGIQYSLVSALVLAWMGPPSPSSETTTTSPNDWRNDDDSNNNNDNNNTTTTTTVWNAGGRLFWYYGITVPVLALGPILTLATWKYITAVHELLGRQLLAPLLALLLPYWFGVNNNNNNYDNNNDNPIALWYASVILFGGALYLFGGLLPSPILTRRRPEPPRPNPNYHHPLPHLLPVSSSSSPSAAAAAASSSWQEDGGGGGDGSSLRLEAHSSTPPTAV